MKQSILTQALILVLVAACGSGGRPERVGSRYSGGNDDAGGSRDKPVKIGDSVANDPLAKDGTDFFPGKSTDIPKKRIFRLTQTQFDETIKFLLPGVKPAPISQFLATDPKQTNYDYADFLAFNAANFTPYAKWVEGIASAVETAPTSVVNCPLKLPITSCHKDAAQKFVHRAFRGAADSATRAVYTKFFEDSFTANGSLGPAVRRFIEAILMAPHFTFRAEFSTTPENLLTPGEDRQNLAYTLGDSPIPELIGEAAETPLAKNVIDTAIQSKEAKAKLSRFFIDWLEIRSPAEMRISKEVFPEFTDLAAQAAVDETNAHLNFYLSQPAPKLSDIVRSRKSFVTAATKVFYAKDEGKGAGAEHDPALRFGVFTQPAFVASRSGPIESNVIKRGVFFMRKVMCLDTGMIPSGIDTTISDKLGNTERERIEAKTSIPACIGCHRVINPFGFAFENYDPIGRWRTEEHGFPVDPKVSMEFLGEAGLVTDSPVNALDYFTKSDRFKQCFVRQMFRYYMGRNELPGDDPTLKAMFEQIKKDESVVEVLRTLVTSPRMNSRK